jgi:hypothetical protein
MKKYTIVIVTPDEFTRENIETYLDFSDEHEGLSMIEFKEEDISEDDETVKDALRASIKVEQSMRIT